MSQVESTRKRKRPAPNWYPDEVEILINEASEHESLLSARLNNSVAKEDKNRIWKEISTKVSMSGKYARSPNACKKKWMNQRSVSVNKVRTWMRETRKTGNDFYINSHSRQLY